MCVSKKCTQYGVLCTLLGNTRAYKVAHFSDAVKVCLDLALRV